MRVLLVDDHSLFANGLRNLLEIGGITVVGIARDGTAALRAVREYQPDVVLMDIEMPGCDGLAATRLIKMEFPDIRIIILTINDDDQALFAAAQSGASGFLLKNLEAEEFLKLLTGLEAGQSAFSPGLADRLQQLLDQKPKLAENEASAAKPLTSRQQEILADVAHGLTYKEIGERLKIRESTVKYHMSEILARLNFENRAQAITYALKANLIKFDE